MPEYLYPGVYVEEIAAGTPIPGVATCTQETSCTALRRPSFFAGRLLDAATLRAEQDYHREKLRRHVRALHGFGVVSGLEAQVTTGPDGAAHVQVAPGCAVDGCGELLVLTCPATVTAARQHDRASLSLRYEERGCAPVPTPRGSIDSAVEEGCVVAVTPWPMPGAVPIACLARIGGAWQVDQAFVVPRARCLA